MPSFREIVATKGPVLLLDAASARIQVGWLDAHAPAAWAESEADAGVGLFRCLEKLQVEPANAGAFVFSCGPGSVLGIRTTAMAIRAWSALKPRPVFSYQSLAILAHALESSDLTIIADARRESWHAFNLGSGLRRVPPAELTGNLVLPEGFRTWSTPPKDLTRVPYALQTMIALPHVENNVDVLSATESPDAFLHETPSYATWTPQVHRAP